MINYNVQQCFINNYEKPFENIQNFESIEDTYLQYRAAENLKLTAQDLLDLEVIDEIIKEPIGGAHRNVHETCDLIKDCLVRITKEFENMTAEEIILHREKKYLEIGNKFLEN